MRLNFQMSSGAIIRSRELTETDMPRETFRTLLSSIGKEGNIRIPNKPNADGQEQFTIMNLAKIDQITIIDPLYQED